MQISLYGKCSFSTFMEKYVCSFPLTVLQMVIREGRVLIKKKNSAISVVLKSISKLIVLKLPWSRKRKARYSGLVFTL